jgi:hypothetical protein
MFVMMIVTVVMSFQVKRKVSVPHKNLFSGPLSMCLSNIANKYFFTKFSTLKVSAHYDLKNAINLVVLTVKT